MSNMAARSKFRSLQYTLDLDSMDIQDILSQSTNVKRAKRSQSLYHSGTQDRCSQSEDLSVHSRLSCDFSTSPSPPSPACSPGNTTQPMARSTDSPRLEIKDSKALPSSGNISQSCSASSQCDFDLLSSTELSVLGNEKLPDTSKPTFLSHFEYDDSSDMTNPLIPPNHRGDTGAICDALNKMYVLLSASQNKFDAYIRFNDTRVSHIGESVISLTDRVDKLSDSVNHQVTALKSLDGNKVSSQVFNELKSDFSQFKSSCDLALEQAREVYSKQQLTIKLQQQLIANANLDVKRLNNDLTRLTERMNVSEIKSQAMNIFVEGLPESQELSTVDNLLNRFNGDADTDLSEDDFFSIHRVGKY